MIRPVFALVFAAAVSGSASASSSDAWAEHEKAVAEACVAASGLKDAKPHTGLILFDDSVGYDAMVIEGEYPQEHMKGEHGAMLCLYNKAEAKAVASELVHK